MRVKQRYILLTTMIMFALSSAVCFAGGKQEEEPPTRPQVEKQVSGENLPEPAEEAMILMKVQSLVMIPDKDADVALTSEQAEKIIVILEDWKSEIQKDLNADISSYASKVSKVLTAEQNELNMQMQGPPAGEKGERPQGKSVERPEGNSAERPQMLDPVELLSQLIDGLEEIK